MKVETQVNIKGSKAKIWEAITDIENAVDRISGIEKVEILERPQDDDLVGLKWRETRTLFGKTATEVMWITEAVKNEYYTTRAESHGAIYRTKLSITGTDGDANLNMEFSSQAQSLGAKILAVTMGSLFKNATKKALAKDLEDIKAAVEN